MAVFNIMCTFYVETSVSAFMCYQRSRDKLSKGYLISANISTNDGVLSISDNT